MASFATFHVGYEILESILKDFRNPIQVTARCSSPILRVVGKKPKATSIKDQFKKTYSL